MQNPFFANISKIPIPYLYNSCYFNRLYENWVFENPLVCKQTGKENWFWFTCMKFSFNYLPSVIVFIEWSEFFTIEDFAT